jgi:hypothetical protein
MPEIDLDRPLLARAFRALATACRTEVTTYSRAVTRDKLDDIQDIADSIFEEREFLLECAIDDRSKALDKLVDVINADAFRDAFTQFLNAETEIALCGADIDQYTTNRAALLDDDWLG